MYYLIYTKLVLSSLILLISQNITAKIEERLTGNILLNKTYQGSSVNKLANILETEDGNLVSII